MVQEAIIQLVTNNNLFMVGDVKQSIYRFRLAEPNLFLGKYNRFTVTLDQSGLKIDLAKNFRSRKEVLDGTNYLFKQVMGESVGEIDYNEAAELKVGASYPEDEKYPIEWMLIDQQMTGQTKETGENPAEFDQVDLEQSQLEARLMAQKIKGLINERKLIYHSKTKTKKPVTYRDIVILLRSMSWAPEMIEEFKQQGIPVYANLSTGYFEATEVEVMISLLKVIDNPIQDIPLASVLRSPIVNLDEEEMAKIRIHHKQGSFYECLSHFCSQPSTANDEEIHHKVVTFYEQLQQWRTKARQGALSELIWQLYRDTRFYDYVGGMPGGKQRQANLRALYDRARQYEETSFRGLFRFLRFIERMRDRGDDLGTARSLGEQEDVVRIMTIHSSKGLEFPVVFVAGLGRNFNLMDLRKAYLLDKKYGIATKYVNAVKRITYPSLPQLAFKWKKSLEMIAEEMRVLYVALTRAKEKLYLISTVKSLEKELEHWINATNNPNWLLDEFSRAKATSYLDWIGPALIRHQDCKELYERDDSLLPKEIVEHPSCWKFNIVKSEQLSMTEVDESHQEEELLVKLRNGQNIPITSSYADTVHKQLSWKYVYQDATVHRAKQSVSEVKRQHEITAEESGTDYIRKIRKPMFNRPRFMQQKSLTPAERGTAMHAVMQHIDLSQPVTELSVTMLVEDMVQKELLTGEQQETIAPETIVQFFETEVGKRLLKNWQSVRREVPFSLSIPASTAYANWNDEDEPVLIQGVIDCLFEDQNGLILLDYKTDNITERYKRGFSEAKPILEAQYRVQIDLYTKAVEQILKRPVLERYLYFFDGANLLQLK
ncbi:helicase-exonuclease AddAB subunit AddA [Bacillus aquiflavi]|nr:helicase-exonuclease AddAB subunit AddA [Bacillus aquiflavi]